MIAATPSRDCILITGAGGFVGRWLTDALRDRMSPEARLALLVRDAEDRAATPNGVVCDLRDAASVERLIAELQPTAIIHLAAVSAVSAADRDADMAWDVNVKGTLHLARAVMRHAPQARFIHISTGDVYGGGPGGDAAIDESAALKPRNMYSVTKAASDLLIGQMAGTGLKAVRFRPFNHTGPGQTTDFVVAAFAAQIAEIEHGLKAPTIDVGNLDAYRDFCDVRDVVKIYAVAAIGDVDLTGRVMNLASGTARRVGDVLEDLLALARVRIELRQDPARMRASDTPRIDVDASLARELVGWRTEIPWRDTLTDVLDYWRQTIGAQFAAGRSVAKP